MKNDGDHGLLSCLTEVTCTSGAVPKCSMLGNGGASGDVPGCCLADSGVPWPLAGLAFEPRLKKAKLEVIHETLPAPLPHW